MYEFLDTFTTYSCTRVTNEVCWIDSPCGMRTNDRLRVHAAGPQLICECARLWKEVPTAREYNLMYPRQLARARVRYPASADGAEVETLQASCALPPTWGL